MGPVDPALVAARLAEAVHASPAGRLAELAGPEVSTLTALAATWRTARHHSRLLALPVPLLGRAGHALRTGALTAPAAAAGGPNFGEWLAAPEVR